MFFKNRTAKEKFIAGAGYSGVMLCVVDTDKWIITVVVIILLLLSLLIISNYLTSYLFKMVCFKSIVVNVEVSSKNAYLELSLED